MKAWIRSLRQTLEQQIETWQNLVEVKKKKKSADLRVITVSRQAGTGGRLVATRVAQMLQLKLFDRDIIQKVAQRSHTDAHEVASRDEKGGSMIEEWVNTLLRHRYLWPEKVLHQRYLWPNEYLQHLERVIEDIASSGGGVIVGRGANFMLPRDACLSVRLVAPLEQRVDNVSTLFEVSPKLARRRIEQRDAERKAFVKHYFKKDVADPDHYDLVVNMASHTLEQAAEAVIATWNRFRKTT